MHFRLFLLVFFWCPLGYLVTAENGMELWTMMRKFCLFPDLPQKGFNSPADCPKIGNETVDGNTSVDLPFWVPKCSQSTFNWAMLHNDRVIMSCHSGLFHLTSGYKTNWANVDRPLTIPSVQTSDSGVYRLVIDNIVRCCFQLTVKEEDIISPEKEGFPTYYIFIAIAALHVFLGLTLYAYVQRRWDYEPLDG